MLDPWSLGQSRALKRSAWALWEGANLRAASAFHATSTAEEGSLRRLGLQQATWVIPNGVEVRNSPSTPQQGGNPRRLLFLSRYHPKKGGDLLLETWALLHHAFPDWRLDFFGPDPEGHRTGWERLARQLGLTAERVGFNGAVEGEAKWDLLAGSGLLVLPSHGENFGNVVLEALASGIPVITTHGTPWEGLETRNCGWWIPCEIGALERTIRAALSLPEEARRAMGERGRSWAEAFSWTAVARRMAEAYESLLKRR
jgi:glycosyltransferase involved in cell wall biosynthesis